jgi:uncharacterized lipoprotein NlpE involved in copper resistance
MKKLTVLAALVLLLVVGCGKKADYYPLTVGNIWNYTTTTTVTNTDTLIARDTTYSTTSKSEITADVTLANGDAGFEVVGTSGTIVDTSYVSEKDDYVFGWDSLADTTPDTLLVTPLEEGKTWITYSDSTGNVKVTILEKVSGVVVPAGTYDDVWKGMAIATFGAYVDTSYGWSAPNIGDIKREHTGKTVVLTDTMTTTTKTELQSVTIK